MITADAVREIGRPRSAEDTVLQALFYIEQYVKQAAERGEHSTTWMLSDDMRGEGEASALIARVESHGFSVSRADDTLTISWA